MWMDDAQRFFEPDGILSQRFTGFEHRPQQIEMSQAVAASLQAEEHLMVEAGTGTGKSMAYLVPAILWAVEHNKRVVISTYTKTLQEQILDHDIPLLKDLLGIPFRYSLCLGNENYLSLRRMKRASQKGMFNDTQEEEQMNDLFSWVPITKTGRRQDLPFEPLPSVWEEVGRQKDLCLGKNCETYQQCFYFKERRKWFASHLLIVNHHLFFANIANQGAVLPRFDAVIFDEAQNLEEVGTSFLGLEISNTSLFYFLDRLYNGRTKRGTLNRLPDHLTHEIKLRIVKVRQAAEAFFQNIFDQYGTKDRTLRFYQRPVLSNTIYSPMKELYESLKSLEGHLESEEDILDATSAGTRCFEFNNALAALLNQELEDYVYWLEIADRKRQPRAILKGVPINIREEMRSQVFDKHERVVMTSATMTTDKKFDYMKERIGFEPQNETILDSPFDYPRQALLYLPEDIPEPTENTDTFVKGLADRIHKLIDAAGGKTFVLFTSYDILNRVHRLLHPELRRYQLLKQGDISPSRMIQRFKEEPSVIFGTSSFWQGVDIPGSALTSVIITKLPFDVPTDPLVEARVEDMKKRGINPFAKFQIPRAIISLRQGFGRLIRKATDYGVVSILDSRMSRRGYGKRFLESLPPCEMTRDFEQVKQFFGRDRAEDSILL